MLPSQHSVDADREQQGGENEKERDGHAQSLLAMTTAPTSAASSSIETTSKGHTKEEKMAVPTDSVVVPAARAKLISRPSKAVTRITLMTANTARAQIAARG